MRLQPIHLPAAAVPRRDTLDTLHALGTCRTLLRLLSSAGFVEDLAAPSPPLSIFAPTDAAFARIEGGVPGLLDPRRDEMLIDLLEYHLVRGRVVLREALAAGGVRTVHGAELHVRADAGEIWADAGRLHGGGIECTNGVVYVVDDVLAPAWSLAQEWIAARTIGAAEPSAWDARSRSRGSFAALEDLFAPPHLVWGTEADSRPEAAREPSPVLAAEGLGSPRFVPRLAPIPLLPA